MEAIIAIVIILMVLFSASMIVLAIRSVTAPATGAARSNRRIARQHNTRTNRR